MNITFKKPDNFLKIFRHILGWRWSVTEMALWCACSLQVLLLKYLVSWRTNRASAVCIYVTAAKKIFWRRGRNLSNYRSVIIRRTILTFEDRALTSMYKSTWCKKSSRSKQLKASSSWQWISTGGHQLCPLAGTRHQRASECYKGWCRHPALTSEHRRKFPEVLLGQYWAVCARRALQMCNGRITHFWLQHSSNGTVDQKYWRCSRIFHLGLLQGNEHFYHSRDDDQAL